MSDRDGKKAAGDGEREKTGDDRIVEEKLEKALVLVDRGNNHAARQILEGLVKDAPEEKVRASARKMLRSLGIDPWFYVAWGLSAAVMIAIFIYYILLH
jgi:hypothetical protein